MVKQDTALLEAFAASQASSGKPSGGSKPPTKAPLSSLLTEAGKDCHAILSASHATDGVNVGTVATVKAEMKDLLLKDATERLNSLIRALEVTRDGLTADAVNVSATVDRDGKRTGTVKVSVSAKDDLAAQDGTASGWVSFRMGTAYGFALSRHAPAEK